MTFCGCHLFFHMLYINSVDRFSSATERIFLMSDIFKSLFYHTCCESSSQTVVRQRKKSPAYLEASRRSTELFHAIKEKLEEDDKQLIFQFEDLENEMSSLQEEWVYQQAFRDCLYLLQWMGALQKEE